ncbi:hypothetical protein ABZW18_24515 [Streptomyces sp. NPDC004647]|uniref:hypothetical protein n=1 Tax=Streptomyces sp. NPDC004647 TaxID=3154671 RepID=UPI0033AECD4F
MPYASSQPRAPHRTEPSAQRAAVFILVLHLAVVAAGPWAGDAAGDLPGVLAVLDCGAILWATVRYTVQRHADEDEADVR